MSDLIDSEGQAVADGTSISIEVTCLTCYVKGLFTAELGFDNDFDIGQAITNFTRDLGAEIENVTSVTTEYLEDQFPSFVANLTDDLDFSEIDFPPLDIDFNVDVPDIPECRLRFQFDDLELYMSMDTVLSVATTYTFNLYSSNTPIGLSIDSETFVGVIASIDLIIGVDASIDMTSGLHIKVDDGMALDLSLFSHNVSSVNLQVALSPHDVIRALDMPLTLGISNGASFEFLPVTVQSGSGTLTATLRVGMHAGISQAFGGVGVFPISVGTEAMVYADLAEFTTNITAVPDGDDSGCELRVQQGYQLALGAAAGLTLAIGPETWGPNPSTQIPIFYTTLADECARSVTRTAAAAIIPTPTSTLEARAQEDMTTTTLSTEVTYSGLVCLSTGLVECPASLRSTRKVTSTTTLVVAVPSGSEATFPATTRDAVQETIPFATNVKSVDATTGSPASYVPPPPTTTGSPRGGQGKESGDDESPNIGLIVGLSVGLGVPFLAAVGASI